MGILLEDETAGATAFGGLPPRPLAKRDRSPRQRRRTALKIYVLSRLMGSRTRRRQRAFPWKGIRGER